MTPSSLQWLCPTRLFDGATVQTGLALGLADGTVAKVCPVAELPPGTALPVNGLVTPGFLDLQVNGGGGVLLNQTPTPAGIAAIAAAHRRFGTVGIMPTVITDAPDVLASAVAAALAAKDMPGVLGLHIEGPHISVPRRGTHAERFVRPMDATTIGHVEKLRTAGVAVLITLAPEAATTAQIAALAATGAVVSLGHSDATAKVTRVALAAGATCFTHLFNAMSPMLNREPGVVGAAINSGAYAGIICDGIHVADEMVGLAIRARPQADRMFLVSDAMPTVGGPDRFTLYGREVHLEDGQLVNDEGSLAGAHITMAQSLARLVNTVGVDLTTALRMAVTVPSRIVAKPGMAGLHGRSISDLMILDETLRLAGPLSACLGVRTA
jgi:N-acetylglucosamine-6-phosphate deacetylase